MKFHELHVSQEFIDVYRNRYVKTGHSTAKRMRNDQEVHFTQIAEVDGLQSTNKHPQPSIKYPIPDSDHVGAMAVLADAMNHLQFDKRRNYHESPMTRNLYRISTELALHYLNVAFNELDREHAEATQGDGVR